MRVRMTRTIEETNVKELTRVRYAKGESWTFSAEEAERRIAAGEAVRDEEFETAEVELIAAQRLAAEQEAAKRAAEDAARAAAESVAPELAQSTTSPAEAPAPESAPLEAPAPRRGRRGATESSE